MTWTPEELAALVTFRRRLHANPEISGEESDTAHTVVDFLQPTRPDEIVTRLGGHGVAIIYGGADPGPTVLFRAELDALPIQEIGRYPHASRVAGRAHLCGHDGHTASLAALGLALGRRRPKRGRAVLMFQPAEETGAGAAAVIADSRFPTIAPDLSFAYHNLPGLPLGAVVVAEGPANCASRGLRIVLAGKTAHASQPETGVSPMRAVARLMPALTALGAGRFPERDFAMVTVTHARIGEAAFGIAPGHAEVWATLRTLTDGGMGALVARAEASAAAEAAAEGLGLAMNYHDVFDHVENAPVAVAHLRRALDGEGIAHGTAGQPIRASEDFGRFGQAAPSAMFFVGAGEHHPALHNPDYDFPDVLIEQGARVFLRTARDLLG